MEKTNLTLILRCLSLSALACLACGCAGPTVNLATAEPIKVDIAMRLDVYQHNRETTKKPVAAAATAPANPEDARRTRMADVQHLKNSRLVGESRDGLLAIQGEVPGDYGEYVRKTVAQENADRMALMTAAAEKDKLALTDVQKKQAELWRNRAFTGEILEVQGTDGTWSWIPKSE